MKQIFDYIEDDSYLESAIKNSFGYQQRELIISLDEFKLELAKSLKFPERIIKRLKLDIDIHKKNLQDYIDSFNDLKER